MAPNKRRNIPNGNPIRDKIKRTPKIIFKSQIAFLEGLQKRAKISIRIPLTKTTPTASI